MKYTVTPAEKSTVKLTMTFTPEEWSAAIDKAYLQNRGKYAVNGFRKGKAPKHVLELYYGKGLFYEDALNILYGEHYYETLAAERENFFPVGEPSLSVDDLSDEKVVMTAVVPVKPDVEIKSYKGIKINRFEYTVTDADVDRDIQATRERLADSVEVTDRPCAMGDTVNIDFVGKLDGKAFEGGSAEKYDLTLGSHSFIPGFEEQVAGMEIGAVKDIEVTFPEDYASEELKGKKAVFTVTLHAVKGKVLPELDDAFAQKMNCDSMDAYRVKVRERLERNAAARGRNETENAIITEIAKGASAEIPEAMIDRQEDEELRKLETDLMYQGIRLDDYLTYIGTTRDAFKKNYEEAARKTVLHQLIVEKIIKLENLAATQEEVDAKVAEQAASVGKTAEEYKKTLQPRQLEYIRSDIAVTKLFDFLMANNEMVAFTEEKPAKKSAAKKTAAKKAEGGEAPAKKPAAKKTAAKKAEDGEAPAKKPAAKKTAKKTTEEA